MIKLWQTKSWRNQKLVQRFKTTVENQLIQTKSVLGLEVSRVQTQKGTQKKFNQLKFGKLEAYLEDAEEQHDDADQVGDKPLVKGWLRILGTILLGLSRNSNCSAQDLGLVLMDDTFKSTVLRATCKVGAALIASSRLFFEHWKRDMFDGPRWDTDASLQSAIGLTFLHYREDATNHRHKMVALELRAAYLIADRAALEEVSFHDLSAVKRLADGIPVQDARGIGTLALTEKMLRSLGCPTWWDFIRQHMESTATTRRLRGSVL